MLAAREGAATHGAGIVITRLQKRTMGDPQPPLAWLPSSHKPALLCLEGGQGNSFVCFCFPCFVLFLFGLLLAPPPHPRLELGSVEVVAQAEGQ